MNKSVISDAAPSMHKPWGKWQTALLISLFLLSPKIGFFDISIIALFVLLLIANVRPTVVSNYFGLVMLTFISIILLISISSLINQRINVEQLSKPIRNIIIIYSFFLISKKIFNLENLFFSIGIAGIINSVVILAQYVGFIFGYGHILMLYPISETANQYRMTGLASGFPPSAVLSAIAASIFLINYYSTLNKTKLIFMFFCLPGCLLSSRTGLFLFLSVCTVLLLYSTIKKRLVFILTSVAVVFLIVVVVTYFTARSDSYFTTVYIMFEPVFVYLDQGRIGVSSTDDLMQNHYFYPENFAEWIIGNSKEVNVPGGILSDVWLTQNLISSGILVVIAYLFIFISMFYFSVRATNGSNRFLVCVVFLFVLISSVKGSYLFSRFVGDVATMTGVYVISRHKKYLT